MPDWSKHIQSLLLDIQLEAAREAEIVEELTQHLNDAYEDGLANGFSPQEAKRVALAPLDDGTLTANLRSTMTIARPEFTPGRAESRNFLASIWAGPPVWRASFTFEPDIRGDRNPFACTWYRR
jgi:hypothetical protein